MLRLPVLAEEPAQLFAHPDGVTWRRTGFCCQCGACCVGDPEDLALALCSKFAAHADGVGGHCTAHGTDHWYYRAACAAYPQHPAQVADKPLCTFRFEALG